MSTFQESSSLTPLNPTLHSSNHLVWHIIWDFLVTLVTTGTLYGDNGDDDGFGDGDTEHEAEGIADGSLAPDETVRKNYFSRPLKCDDGQSFNREKVGKRENI